MRAVKDRSLNAIATARLTPLEVVQARMAGEEVNELVYRAAVELLPYTTPRLSAIAVAPMTKSLEDLLREADEIRRRKTLIIEGPRDLQSRDASLISASFGQSEATRTHGGPASEHSGLVERAKALLPAVSDPAQRAELQALIRRAERS